MRKEDFLHLVQKIWNNIDHNTLAQLLNNLIFHHEYWLLHIFSVCNKTFQSPLRLRGKVKVCLPGGLTSSSAERGGMSVEDVGWYSRAAAEVPGERSIKSSNPHPCS